VGSTRDLGDDEQKEVQAIEIKTFRGIHLDETLSSIQLVRQMSE
jgi:hypothetical protein